jgi:hypothetical protein
VEEVRSVLADHRDELARHRVMSLRVFGSTARGDARPDSDVDFLVEFHRPAGLLVLAGLQQALEEWLDRPVDIGTADSLRPAIRDRALAEAVDAA